MLAVTAISNLWRPYHMTTQSERNEHSVRMKFDIWIFAQAKFENKLILM
jgi:hypothetical protein